MAILDVQVRVKMPQDSLQTKYSIESQPQNLAEKGHSFARHLKKVSQKETINSSRQSVRKELLHKNIALERSAIEQKASSMVDSNGGAENLTPAQEQQITQPQSSSDTQESAEVNQSMAVSSEPAPAQEIDKQIKDEVDQLAAASADSIKIQGEANGSVNEETITVIVDKAKLQNQAAEKQIQIQVETSQPLTTELEKVETQAAEEQVHDQVQVQTSQPSAAGSEIVKPQVSEEKVQAQVETPQPLVAVSETIKSQIAEKQYQGSGEVAIPVSESAQIPRLLEGVRAPISGNEQYQNVQEGQGEEISADAKLSTITPTLVELNGEPTTNSSLARLTTDASPQGESAGETENQATDATVEQLAAKQVLGTSPTVNGNAIPSVETEQSAEIILAASPLSRNTTVTDKDTEHPKTNEKNPMNPKLLEKLLGDKANPTAGESEVKDVKKIMEFENHRLVTRKLSADAPPIEETAQQKGVEEGKTLTFLDKTLIELARPGSETGKMQPTSTAAPVVSPEETLEQIIKNVELVSKQASSEMKIQLKPEFLGKMMIQIVVNDGVVTARFTTESQHVKQVLEANMNSLKQTLEANGLRVERTEVNVQLDNGGNFNNSSEGNRQQLWQQMASQGRIPTHYNALNNAYTAEVEGLNPYQREVDTPQFIDEGRVDFTI